MFDTDSIILAADLDARDRAQIRRAVADELRDQTERLEIQHAAVGSQLLRIYRSRTPSAPAWLDPNAGFRRWFGSPLTLVGLITSTLAACIEGLTTFIPDGWGWWYVGGIAALLILRILYHRVSGRAAGRNIDHRERAHAFAETASDCIAVGTTHVAYSIAGTLFDRHRIAPARTVILADRTFAAELTDIKGKSLVRIENPWVQIVQRGRTSVVRPPRHPTASPAPSFGQRP